MDSLNDSTSNTDSNDDTTSVRGNWHVLDQRLREYARHRSALDAAEAFDLVCAERMRIYALVGCASHYEYMERLLGYGPHAGRERMRVARALVSLPRTSMALAAGELSFSTARELTRVATADTEDEWLLHSIGKSVRQVEELVAGHAPGDLPTDPKRPDLRTRTLRLELPTEVFALWRQARMALADERGGEVSDVDLIETMCRRILDPGSGADAPPHRIAYTQCAECKRATQNGAGREIDVRPDVIERAACDARVIGSIDSDKAERATTTVTPRMREQIFIRDKYRCTVPGCRSARNLEIHHLIEQAYGGPHELWNCTLVCGGHHAALHAGLLSMQGRAPHEIEVRWAYGPPLPPHLDAAGRAAMIATRIAAIIDSVPRGTCADDHEATGADEREAPTG